MKRKMISLFTGAGGLDWGFHNNGNYDLNFIRVNAQERFYAKLKGVTDPEQKRKIIPVTQRIEETILSLRKTLQISNIGNLKNLVPEGAFRLAQNKSIDSYVMGAWLRICQIIGEKSTVNTCFDPSKVDELIEIGPGVISAIVIRSENSSKLIRPYILTICSCIKGMAAYPPPTLNNPI